MGGGEPDVDLSSPRGNTMTILVCSKREVMAPPFFVIGFLGLLGYCVPWVIGFFWFTSSKIR